MRLYLETGRDDDWHAFDQNSHLVHHGIQAADANVYNGYKRPSGRDEDGTYLINSWQDDKCWQINVPLGTSDFASKMMLKVNGEVCLGMGQKQFSIFSCNEGYLTTIADVDKPGNFPIRHVPAKQSPNPLLKKFDVQRKDGIFAFEINGGKV